MELFLINKIEELAFVQVGAEDALWPHVLDSITIVELAVEIENKFNISIPPQDIVEENFHTVSKIAKFISSKLS